MILSIVIPCYNESAQIAKTVGQVLNFMSNKLDDFLTAYHIVLVNDGSTDITDDIMNNLHKQHDNVHVVSYSDNHGKGYAVKAGLLHDDADIVLFMDADLSTGLNAINGVLSLIKYGHLTRYAIIGTRYAPTSFIAEKQGFLRRVMSQTCIRFVNKQLGLQVTDSQCGFKCFDRKTADLLVTNQTVEGFAFDAEYLYLTRQAGIEIIELPVVWANDSHSSVKPFAAACSYIKAIKKIKKTRYEL